MLVVHALAAASLLMVCVACDDAPDRPAGQVAASSLQAGGDGQAGGTGALPAGALVELVPSPAEVPAGFAVVAGDTGPLTAAAAAELAAKPSSAGSAGIADGVSDGYAAAYGNERTGAFLSVLVVRFAAASGADAGFGSQVRAASDAASPVRGAAKVGDESAVFGERVTDGDAAEIATVIFRVRDLVWRVRAGGQQSSDAALARDIAGRLARRIV